MAEPVKIKFDYQNPDNVEAEVPGAQKIREPQNESKTHSNKEESTNKCENPNNNGENTNVSSEGLEVATNDDFSEETVIVVTKKEATFVKGDLKLQKVTVTEDISVKYQHLFKKQTLPGKTIVTQESPENGDQVTGEPSGDVTTRGNRRVFGGKRNGIHGEPVMLGVLLSEKSEDKPKTRIPVSKFKQTVDKIRAERRLSSKEHESHIPVRKSSIPKLVKELKTQPSTVKKDITMTKSLIKNDTAEVVTKIVTRSESKESTKTVEKESIIVTSAEDEFDKLFADVVTNSPIDVNIDDSLLDPKLEDFEKLESKFKEIIHDYEEHRVEPIDVEVVRRSKLPQLKRRSQQDMESNTQAERTSKIIAARDKLRLRHSINKDENLEKALDEELKKANVTIDSKVCNDDSSIAQETPKVDTKTETKHEIISSPNSKRETLTQSTNTVSTSSTKDENSTAKETPKVDTKSETKYEIISSPNSKTETLSQSTEMISTSSTKDEENKESSSIVQTTTVKEITKNETNDRKEDKIQYMTEENIIKGSIKIGIPVFDSQIHEYSETNASSKTVEIRQTMSYTSTNEELSVSNKISETKSVSNVSEISNELNASISKIEHQTSVNEISKDLKTNSCFERQISKSKEYKPEDAKTDIEATIPAIAKPTSYNKTETENASKSIKEKETDADELQLRVKVKKIINKTVSKEAIETEGNQRESINELIKKKSVLSKIAMFERKPEESTPPRGPKKETKLPKLITKDWQKVDHIHVHTPLIVDEVFKPFDTQITPNGSANKDENIVKNDTIIKTERVTLESSDSVHYVAENKNEIENKSIQENPINVEQPINIEDNVHLRPKIQRPKLEIRSTELSIHDLPTSAVKDFEFKYNLNKVQSPTRLGMTKEIQPPIIIPGFKPVRTMLKSFESRNEENEQKHNIQRSFSKEKGNVTRKFTEINNVSENKILTAQISKIDSHKSESYDAFETVNDYKSLDEVFIKEEKHERIKLRKEEELKRAQSLAELDLGDAFKGKVNSMILRMKSMDRTELERKETISKKEMPRKRSVSEKIALFEGKLSPSKGDSPSPLRLKIKTDITVEKSQNTDTLNRIDVKPKNKEMIEAPNVDDEQDIKKKIEELKNAKSKYGKVADMAEIELSNGVVMPVLTLGTALLDPRLTYHIVCTAIELGYRGIDCAYIYGTEQLVGNAIRDKIADGTVTREQLFIISKLWSTYHRTDLVEEACRASLDAMGLTYFDLYLIHNPMSFKEGSGPIPKIATVLQYSESDYLDAWYGMEDLVAKGLVRAIGVSNFNSMQLQRVLDKGKIKPVVNQVECHPYLSQQRLDLFCAERNVTLSCFGVLGSKGTPPELKNGQPAVIDDALVQVMASGLGITPAQLLISYQLENGHGVVVKASSAKRLHDNLLALGVSLTSAQVDALHALNRNKRMFTFKGMGDTHKNYPFHAPF